MNPLKRSEVEAWTKIGPTVVLDELGQPTRYVWQLEDPNGQRWEYDRLRGQVRRVPEPGESADWLDLG